MRSIFILHAQCRCINETALNIFQQTLLYVHIKHVVCIMERLAYISVTHSEYFITYPNPSALSLAMLVGAPPQYRPRVGRRGAAERVAAAVDGGDCARNSVW